MRIKASSTIRGEIVLSSVKRSLVAEQQLFINEDEFWNDDIQQALSLGLIEVIEGLSEVKQNRVQKRYTIRNNHRNVLVFSVFEGRQSKHPKEIQIEPGGEFTVSENVFYSAGIQQAVDLGLLEVVQVISNESPVVLKDAPEQESPVVTKTNRQPKPLPESILPGRAPLTPKSSAKKAVAQSPAKKLPSKLKTSGSALSGSTLKAGPKKTAKKINAIGRARTSRTVTNEDSGVEDDGIEMEIVG